MRRLYLLHFLALVVSGTALAQNPGDFRSAASGPWHQASTWETFDGVTWNAAVTPPDASSGTTSITAFTTVDITTTVTGDEIIVEGDAVLNIQANGGNLTVASGGLVVTEGDGFFTTDGFMNVLGGLTPGIVNSQGTITSSLLNLQIDGTYIHAQNGGLIPNGSWNDGSLLSITGITTAPPSGLSGQSFYDVTWNCTQSVGIVLAGTLTSVRHNLSILNTGSAAGAVLSLTSSASGAYDPLVIGGDLTVAGNATLGFGPNTGGNTYTVTIGGNFNVSSTKTTGVAVGGQNSTVTVTVSGNFNKTGSTGVTLANTASATTNCSATLEVNGDITWGGGTLTMANGSNASNTNVGTLNVGGNLTISSGTFTETSSSTNGRGVIVFDDAHTHNFTSPIASPFAQTINFSIPSSNRVNIGSTTSFSGIGGLTLSAGATLGIASSDGISAASSIGNIRVSSISRSYAVNSNIIYNGSSLQNLGDEWGPTGKLNGIAVNLEIANAAGVINNITPSTNLVGNLTLTSGAFDIGSGNSLTIQSNFTATGGTISGHQDSNLTFAGSGTITGNLNFTSGAAILSSLTINRGSSIVLGSDLTINQTGTLAFQSSGNLLLNGTTLTVNGDITQVGVGAIASNVATSNLVISGSGTLTALPITASSLFNNVTLARTGGASYTWNSAATVSGNFDLSSGTFTHSSGLTMGTGSTFKRSSGSTYSGSTPNATTRYSLTYTGTLTTANELPTVALDRLENLTIGGDVTLNKAIRINGDLNINTGKLAASTFNVTMLGATFAVNGGTFEQSSSSGVTFSRAGSTTLSGSTINDIQFGNFTISGTTTVVAPNANINVNSTWTNSGTFTPGTGTVTFNGATQTLDTGGKAFYNVATSGGTKTLNSTLNVNNDLLIGVGSTLAAGANTINIAGTWDNSGTFTPGTGVVVFNGTAQSIENNGQAFNAVTFANSGTKTLTANFEADGALTINSGVTLDVSVNNYNLLAGGAFVNNGTFNPRQGTVTFDGGLPQTVSGSTNTQFYNITQTNATSVSISSAQSLVNALTLSAGTFNPNGNFTLISNASGDARINDLTSGGTIGNSSMIIQRYLPNTAGVSVARYMSSPVSNAMMSQWKDDFPITGPISDHSTVAEWVGQGISPYPFNETGNSIQIYNEAKTPTTSLNDRYEGYPTSGTIATTPLVAGVGYNVRPRVTAAITPEVVGRPNFGPVSVTVTAQGVTSNDGWNLVGNPYPAPINWNNVSRPSGVSAQIALTDNTNNIGTGAGNYIYYTAGGTGIPITYTGTIAQGQAFWVRKTTAGSASLTFQEDDKQATSTPPFVRQRQDDILRINVAGNGKSDELVILFADDAKDTAESERDASKLPNPVINFYSMSSDNKELAINTMGALGCSREIPLVLAGVSAGSHILTFSQLETFGNGVDIRLLDAFTGQTFVVTEASAQYNFSVTSDPNSFGASRFKVYVGYKDLDLSMSLQAADGCNGSDAQVKIIAPQKGVSYYATINGTSVSDKFIATGSELVITIPAANLTQNESQVVLKAQNGTCAEMPLTNSVTVKKNGIPVVSQVSEATGCGESSLTLTAQGAPDGGSYRWYLTEDATDAIAGETSSSFTTPTLAKTKTYFVSAVSALGCESGRVPVTATISYVDQATITEQNGVLVSNSDTGNQWYLNGNPIPGATSKTYKPGESGVYRLVVTTGTCSSQVEQEYAVTGDIDGEQLKGYVLYPNPSSGTIYVEVATTNEVRVSIVNSLGKEVTRGELKQEGNRRKGQFDITTQGAGVYLVVIKNDQETVTKKIIKN